jgi:hypothetical protein
VAGSDSGQPNVNLLGRAVYTTYLFPFEATAALLIIAVVGAVVLARRPPVTVNPVEDDEPSDGGPDGQGDGEAPDASDASLDVLDVLGDPVGADPRVETGPAAADQSADLAGPGAVREPATAHEEVRP